MTTETYKTYYERINQVKQYIREHMDEPLNRETLADIAGFSVAHFHRIFLAIVGENITSYVRRVRLERAARRLLAEDAQITDIALASGYETHSAFDKAFKQYLGISPTEFRELNVRAAYHIINRRMLYHRKEFIMQPYEIRTLSDTSVLYARASEVMSSTSFQTAHMVAFNHLMGFLSSHQLMDKVRQTVALYPDEAEIGKDVRFDAGAIFVEGVMPDATSGLAYQTLPAGRWAIFRHVGPYDTLWQTWQAIFRDWLPTSGQELRHTVPFEHYVDDPS